MNPLVVERRIRVARSAADCFAYLADFSTCEQWDAGVDRARKLTPGAPAVGSEFDLQLRVLGRRVPMRYRLTALDPNRELVLKGQGDGFAVLDRIGFLAMGEQQTEIHYRADMDLGAIPALVRPLAQAWCERIGTVAMQGLQSALDDDARFDDRRVAGLADRLVLPAARDFTVRGYRRMRTRGLSRRLDGKIVAITGPTSGLGLATAQLLGRLGATLLLVGRGRERLDAAAAAVSAFAGPVDIQCFDAELSEIAECRRVATELAAVAPQLDVLINNAGALPTQRTLTAEGQELALAINLLAPYTLSTLLQPSLAAAGGRVINVVSGGLYLQPLRLDDLSFEHRPYDGTRAYAQAKRGLLAMTQWCTEQHGGAGPSFHAMHPGWAATPGVASSLPGFERVMRSQLRDARMGADTAVWLASHPQFEDPALGGRFWFDRAPRPTDVIPGTQVSPADRAALAAWLAQRCGC